MDLDHETLGELSGLWEETPALFAIFDPEDRVRYGNRAFREAFFIASDEQPTWPKVLRRNHEAGRGAVISDPDFDNWLSSVASRRGKTPIRYFESDLLDGRCLWVVETVNANGWMQLIATDVTQIRPAGRSLRLDRDLALKAAQTDDLTGISNRRHIMDMLGNICAAGKESQPEKGCVCLLDIDHFKNVNDTWGHQAGDEALVSFAHLVRSQIRLQDSFGRIGGEEFLLVFQTYSLEEATKMMGRLFDKVRASSLIKSNDKAKITFSAGMAELCVGDSVETIHRRADKALYAAKQNGRDRMYISSDGKLSCVLADEPKSSRSRSGGKPTRAA